MFLLLTQDELYYILYRVSTNSSLSCQFHSNLFDMRYITKGKNCVMWVDCIGESWVMFGTLFLEGESCVIFWTLFFERESWVIFWIFYLRRKLGEVFNTVLIIEKDVSCLNSESCVGKAVCFPSSSVTIFHQKIKFLMQEKKVVLFFYNVFQFASCNMWDHSQASIKSWCCKVWSQYRPQGRWPPKNPLQVNSRNHISRKQYRRVGE